MLSEPLVVFDEVFSLIATPIGEAGRSKYGTFSPSVSSVAQIGQIGRRQVGGFRRSKSP